MKKIVIVIVLLLLSIGITIFLLRPNPKEETRLYIYSEAETFQYDNCEIFVKKIHNDCVLEQNCKENDEVNIDVEAGDQYTTFPYTINNKKMTKIKPSACYLKVVIDEYGTALVLYK